MRGKRNQRTALFLPKPKITRAENSTLDLKTKWIGENHPVTKIE